MFHEETFEPFDIDEIREEVKPKKTLKELLEKLRSADEDLESYDLDLLDLGQEIRTKVDGIVEYLEFCEERANTFKKRMKMFEKKSRSFENRAKSLRQYVTDQMLFDGKETGIALSDSTYKLSGDVFQISLQFRDFVEVKGEPDSIAYIKLGRDVVDRRYVWNKRGLKAAIEKDPALTEKFAEIKQRAHIKIDPKN